MKFKMNIYTIKVIYSLSKRLYFLITVNIKVNYIEAQ